MGGPLVGEPRGSPVSGTKCSGQTVLKFGRLNKDSNSNPVLWSMKCIIKLSEIERRTLQKMSVNHRHRGIRTRAAGLLLIGSGLHAPKAAAALDVSAQSIYNWSRLWRELGLCGLLSGHGGGRPRALSEAMEVARTESMTLGQIQLRLSMASRCRAYWKPCRSPFGAMVSPSSETASR